MVDKLNTWMLSGVMEYWVIDRKNEGNIDRLVCLMSTCTLAINVHVLYYFIISTFER